jgi:anti-repressor protein
MDEIQIFKNAEFGEIRTAGSASEPLFCLADLCKILGLVASQVMKRLDDGVVTIHPILDSLGREQQANFVNEDGLYDVILDSRKPEARKFRKWVTSEVLPAIRRTGGYIAAHESETPEQLAERAVKALTEALERTRKELKKEQKERERWQLRTEIAQKIADDIQQCCVLMKEKLEKLNTTFNGVCDAYALQLAYGKEATICTTIIAKEIGMSAVTLNKKLQELGVQYKQRDTWVLTAKYQKSGYANIIAHTYVMDNGETGIRLALEWTVLGRNFILRLHEEGKL